MKKFALFLAAIAFILGISNTQAVTVRLTSDTLYVSGHQAEFFIFCLAKNNSILFFGACNGFSPVAIPLSKWDGWFPDYFYVATTAGLGEPFLIPILADQLLTTTPDLLVSDLKADTSANYSFVVINRGDITTPATTYVIWVMPGRGEHWVGEIPSLSVGERISIMGLFTRRWYFTVSVQVLPVQGETDVDNNKIYFSIPFHPERSATTLENYPNPFNPITSITYSMTETGLVELKIFDQLGREVTTLVNEVKSAGEYTATFNATELPSGVYFYQLATPWGVRTKKMLLLR